MALGLLAGLVAAALYGTSSPLLAHASRRLPRGPWGRVVAAAVRDPLLLTAVAADGAGAAAHYAAIQLLPLYVAQAEVAGSLLFTALTAATWLGEWPPPRHWLWLAGTCGGLVLLALAAGRPGDRSAGSAFWPLAWACALCCAALGGLALLLRGRSAGVALGALSGLAFGGAPVAARLLTAPFLRWGSLQPLAFLAATGLLGYALFARGLQHARVNAVTAPQVLLEAALPAVVGVAVLGDGVRAGWAWVVPVGLGLSLAGTLGLSATTPPLPEPDGDGPGRPDRVGA